MMEAGRKDFLIVINITKGAKFAGTLFYQWASGKLQMQPADYAIYEHSYLQKATPHPLHFLKSLSNF